MLPDARERPMMARRLSLAIFAVTLGLNVAAMALLATTSSAPVHLAWGFRGYSVILATGGAVIGLILSARVPTNRVGWLIGAVGLVTAVQAVADEYAIVGLLVVPGSLPLAQLVGWLDAWIWVWPVALAAIGLPLIFPSGQLAIAGDRWIAVFAGGAVVASSIGLAITPGANTSLPSIANPIQIPMDDTALAVLGALSYPPLGIAAMLSAVSVVRRFRRSAGETRQQMKWFAFAVSGVGLALGVGLTLGPSLGGPWRAASSLTIIGSFLVLLAAIAVAVLRYRLYDIDRIISRTISYGAVTAVLVAAYIVAVLLLQDPLGSITGGDTIPVAISTLVVAGLFQPLRRQVQSMVDRRFDRARFDAEQTAAAFADRLRDQVDLPMLAADLDATVRQAIAPATVGLWLRGGGR